ncbi:MAG: hypothetical protein M9899_00945 [Bdellovibrionaceae bacterium]|nr:hypothetical protein [Pseudobdellovibrionaceae bacterium]
MDSEYSRNGNIKKKALHFLVKSLSAFFVGFVVSLVGRQLIGYDTFGFIFVGVVFAGLFLKALGRAGLMKILVFDSFFVFLLLLLGMYINLAPKL